MSICRSHLGRFDWLVYWFAFAAFTVDAGRYPGFVAHPETAPYPWGAVLFTCALLGAQTAALNATLRRVATTPSWSRVAAASGLALLFAIASTVTFSTDMPGYYYALPMFALTNVIIDPLVGVALVLRPASEKGPQ